MWSQFFPVYLAHALRCTWSVFYNRNLSLTLPSRAVDSFISAPARATICTAPLCFSNYFLSCAWLHASRERGKMLSTHQISTNMGKLTDIYNIVWRLPEYSVFLFYCVCKPFRFFSAHFLQVKFWNLGRVIGRQIDTDLEFSKSCWKFGTNLMKLPAFAFRTAL